MVHDKRNFLLNPRCSVDQNINTNDNKVWLQLLLKKKKKSMIITLIFFFFFGEKIITLSRSIEHEVESDKHLMVNLCT